MAEFAESAVSSCRNCGEREARTGVVAFGVGVAAEVLDSGCDIREWLREAACG